MTEKSHRLLTIKDTISGIDTTVLLSRNKFLDNEGIAYPRESEHLVLHQIGGTYENLEDFHHEWDRKPDHVKKTILCPECREPITYLIPKLDEFVNFSCMEILDARRLTNALIELLKDGGA